MHPKYKVFQEQMDKLAGGVPTPAWSEETIKRLVAAGATREDLAQISDEIKASAIRNAGRMN